MPGGQPARRRGRRAHLAGLRRLHAGRARLRRRRVAGRLVAARPRKPDAMSRAVTVTGEDKLRADLRGMAARRAPPRARARAAGPAHRRGDHRRPRGSSGRLARGVKSPANRARHRTGFEIGVGTFYGHMVFGGTSPLARRSRRRSRATSRRETARAARRLHRPPPARCRVSSTSLHAAAELALRAPDRRRRRRAGAQEPGSTRASATTSDEVERQHGLTVGTIERPRAFVGRRTVPRGPATGDRRRVARHRRPARGRRAGPLRRPVRARARDARRRRRRGAIELAKLYALALRALAVQQPSPLFMGVDWVSERYPRPELVGGRTFYTAEVALEVHVPDVTNRHAGPPDEPGWPDVDDGGPESPEWGRRATADDRARESTDRRTRRGGGPRCAKARCPTTPRTSAA